MSKRRAPTRNARGLIERRVGVREVRRRFLIVCEGEKTEPNYFDAFQAPGLVVKVKGVGESTLALVKEARRLQGEGDYDQVWCVFDRDDFKPDQINRAIDEAERNGFKIAFSNQAFELWYLLHFHYYNTALSRKQYCELLHKLLGHKYAKNSTAIYEELLSRQAEAIRNARRLLEEHDPHLPPHEKDPSTTVHELVEELNRYRRP